MKVLLDENLPRKLKTDFGEDYEVKTVRDMGWLGKKNGELMALIQENKFDFFITLDKNLRHQQNLNKVDFSVFLLLAQNNKRETLQGLVSKIKERITKGDFNKINEVS
jgi:predicted nuclease of predicted toxin-antitoxin system